MNFNPFGRQSEGVFLSDHSSQKIKSKYIFLSGHEKNSTTEFLGNGPLDSYIFQPQPVLSHFLCHFYEFVFLKVIKNILPQFSAFDFHESETVLCNLTLEVSKAYFCGSCVDEMKIKFTPNSVQISVQTSNLEEKWPTRNVKMKCNYHTQAASLKVESSEDEKLPLCSQCERKNLMNSWLPDKRIGPRCFRTEGFWWQRYR